MKIANKISFSFFLTGIILTSIAAPIFYIIAKSNLEKSISAHLKTAACSRAHHIETFLEMGKEAVKQLSESIVIERFLLTGKDDEEYGRRLADVARGLKDTNKAMKYVYDIFVLNKEGIIIVSSEEKDIGKDKSADPCFLNGKKGVFVKDAYVPEDRRRKTIAFSAPVLDEKNVFLGVFVARVSMEEISKITENRTGLGKTGEIYLLNKHGFMITPSRFTKDTFLKLKVDTKNTKKCFEDIKIFGTKPHKHELILFIGYRGNKVLGEHSHIHEMQWCLLAEIDQSEAFAPLAKLRTIFIIIILAVPAAAWLLGSFISRFITEPLHRLHKGTEIIGAGNLNYKVSTKAKDEIGQLSRAFDKMTDDLKKTTTSIDNLNKEIVERKKAEERLYTSEQKFKALTETTPDWIWEVDKGGVYTYASPKVKELLGYEPSEILGKTPFDLMPEKEVARVGKFFNEKIINKEPFFGLENVNCHKDGHLVVLETSGIPIFDEKGQLTGYRGVDRNITERKKAEEMLISSAKRLERSNKELDDFTYIVSHDLKEPLRIIDAFSKFIADDYKDKLDEQGRMYLERLRANAARMQNLIEDLLEVSRIQRRKNPFEEVDAEEFVNEIKFRLEYAIKEKNAKIAIRDKLPKVFCDRVRLAEVFVNLVSNAIKFNDKPNPRVEIGCSEKDNFYEFYVKDNGPGVEEQYFEKIFEIFQRLGKREKHEGTGAGLTIVKKIVQMHKGKVWLKSDKGEGATFYFTIAKERKV